MQRKFTAYVLVITLLALNFFSILTLDTPSFSIDLGVLQCDMIELYGSGDNHTQTQTDDAREFLELKIGSDTYLGNKLHYYANVGIMLRYGILVYTHEDDNHLDYKGFGDYSRDDNGIYQHRYLGLRKDCDKDAPVTNSLYPNVTGTTTFFSTYMNKNWFVNSDENAFDSWDIPQDPIRDYMLTDKGLAVQDSGVQIPNDSLSLIDIFKNKTGGSVEETMKFATFLAPSSLKYYGEVKGWHKVGAKPYYRTILVNPIEFKEPTMVIEFDKDQYVFAENEQTKTLTGTASLVFPYFKRIGNWKIANYIKDAYITIDGKEVEANVIGDTITTEFSIKVDRDRFKTGKVQDFIVDGEYHLFAYEYLKGDEFVGDGVGATSVLVNPGEVEATFDIQYYKGDGQEKESVKGTTIAVETWETYRLDLVPTIEVFGENEVENVAWVFDSSDMNEIKNGEKDDMVRFIMDESKKETHLTDNKANFTMYVNLKYPFTDSEGNSTSQLVRTGWVEFIEGIPEDEVLPPQEMPPVAKLTVPDAIKQGELFKFSGGRSYDPDGEITEYEFYGDMEIQKMYTESRGRATFLDAGEEDARLRVHDNDDLSDRVKETVEVLNAVEANMRIEGYRKANRRVTLNGEQSTGSYYFPINSYTWSIEPLDGQSMDSIKYDTDNTGKYCDVLFKESGAYQITLTAKADCTFTGEEHRTSQDTVSYPIVIQPDLPPVPQLNVYSLSLRDKMDSLQATIETVDTSYSSDGDETRTKWYYCFDSDNDDSIEDESWQSFGSGQNLDGVKVDNVGDYYFYNVTTDVIPPEDTIARFLTPSDYLSASSIDNALNQHCLVDNVAPVIATSAELKKTVDLLVITDETDHYTDLVSEVYRLKKELFERKISLNDQVVHTDDIDQKRVGSKLSIIYKWFRYLNITDHWFRVYSTRTGKYGGYNDHDRDNFYKNCTDYSYTASYAFDIRKATEAERKTFLSYPEAFGGRANQWSDTADVYNAVNDYAQTVYVSPAEYGTFRESGSEITYKYYTNSQSYLRPRSESSFNAIDQSPVTTTSVSDWVKGQVDSINSSPFDVSKLDTFIDAYKDSPHDKYLIFAIENAEQFYLTKAEQDAITNQYGFKVYFSVDDLYGEFTPKEPEIKDVYLNDEGLYGLTKYGNTVTNSYDSAPLRAGRLEYDCKYSDAYTSEEYHYLKVTDKAIPTEEEKVYYDFEAGRDINTYKTELDTLLDMGFSEITLKRASADVKAYFLNNYRNAPSTGTINEDGIWIREKKYPYNSYYEEDAEGFHYYTRFNYPPESGPLSSRVDIQKGDLYGGTDSPVYAVYGYYGSLIPVSEDESTIFGTIPYHLVDKIYGTVIQVPYTQIRFREIERTPYGDGRDNIIHGVDYFTSIFYKDIYLIRMKDGTYKLVEDELLENQPYETNTWKVYAFDTLDDFTFHKEKIENFGETKGYLTPILGGRSEDEELAFNLKLKEAGCYEWYPSATTNIENAYAYTLVTSDNDLIVDGQFIAQNVKSAYSNVKNTVYVDLDGKVYGAGYYKSGALGRVGVTDDFADTFIPILNNKYTLNATENAKDFSCILDFVSRTPQAIRTDRGDYKTIIDAILDQYDSYRTDETILITVGDEVEMSIQAIDFEGDPIIEKTVEITPVPNYFDNENGVIDIPENVDEPFVIDKAGKAEYRLRVKDNPVGNNDLFDEYRYWNKDNTVINVIAHRKPIAKLSYELVPVTDGVFTFIGDYTGSYDLDHSISRADKGIVDYRYYYRTEYQGEWTQFDGTLPLERGLVYHFALQVKDLEGSWSDYDTADIEVNGELFILNGSIDPPYPTGVPAGEPVTISADILTDKTIDIVTASIEGETSTVSLSKDSTSGNNQVWSGTYTLPVTKADKDYYVVELTAMASDGSTRVYPLKINVSTPINLTGDVSPYEIKKGKAGILTAQTSLYAESCTASLFDDLYGGTAQQINVGLYKDSVFGTLQNWKGTYSFDESLPEGIYQAVFSASTANGNSETDTDTFKFIPNQPPSVSIEQISPDFIYEGDDVVIHYRVQDSDLDKLHIKVEVSEDGGGTWTLIDEIEDLVIEDTAGKVMEVTTENVDEKVYDIRITAVDSLGESGQALGRFSAEPLSVTGAVSHTSQWDENRRLFNQSKTETDEAPRTAQTFWPGEQLVLGAVTTVPQAGATTDCDQVLVYILGHSGSSVALSQLGSGNWQGTLWNEDMMNWKTQAIDVVFEAHYSNGVIKEDIQRIQVDDSEPYWQHHKLF